MTEMEAASYFLRPPSPPADPSTSSFTVLHSDSVPHSVLFCTSLTRSLSHGSLLPAFSAHQTYIPERASCEPTRTMATAVRMTTFNE